MEPALMKPAAVAPPVPLLPAWLAFLCAGGCGVAAGYLATVIRSWTALYEEFDVMLPLIAQFVVDAGGLLSIGLLLVAALLLAAPAVRVSSPLARSLRPLAALLAVGTAGLAGIFLWALVLAVTTGQKMVAQLLAQ